jgi:hypothetical protein
MSLTRQDIIVGAVIIAFSLLLSAHSMRNGVNIAPDEAHFIGYALGVQHGRGLTMLYNNFDDPALTHAISYWPPLYPLIVAGVAFGGSPLQALVVLGYAGMMVTGLLLAVLAYRILRSHFHALAAALLIMTLASSIYPYSRGAAETVFIPLMLIAYTLTLNYRFRVAMPSLRTALALCIVLAFGTLVRNLNIVIALTIAVYVLCWAWSVRDQPVRPHPLLHVIIIGASVIPFGLFSLYNGIVHENPLGMHTLVPTFKLDDVINAAQVIGRQTAHGVRQTLLLVGVRWRTVEIIGTALLVALPIALVARAWWVRRQPPRIVTTRSALWLVILMITVYAVVYLGITAFLPYVFVEAGRYLMPSFIGFVLLVLTVSKWLRVPRVLEIGVLALYCISGVNFATLAGEGVSFNAWQYREDRILQSIAAIVPPDAMLIGGQYPYRFVAQLPYTPMRGSHVRRENGMYYQRDCREMVYFREYPRAALILLRDTPDDAVMLERTPQQRIDFLRAWIAPCGDVEFADSTDVATLIVARIEPALLP